MTDSSAPIDPTKETTAMAWDGYPLWTHHDVMRLVIMVAYENGSPHPIDWEPGELDTLNDFKKDQAWDYINRFRKLYPAPAVTSDKRQDG